ncbi:MAG: hypothetical protein POELPBGB_03533 [Bacteroidia bacterium]|nr:hypothetical protein [Bacteroidia bacterium]
MLLSPSNSVIEDIVRTIELMSEEEQKILLTRLRLQNLLSGKKKAVVGAKKIKPLSLKEIDRIKHDSRKANARK